MTLYIGDITKGIPMGLASPDSGSGGGGGGDLPSNLAYLDQVQSFTRENTFTGGLKTTAESVSGTEKIVSTIELITEPDASAGLVGIQIKYIAAAYQNNILTGTIESTVLTDKDLGGFKYKALTSSQYEALGTPDKDTMYRITDTGKVYLGTVDISGGGGGSAVPSMYAGSLAGGQNSGNVGEVTITVDDLETT